MAWLVRPRTLDDLPRLKANLRVSCLDCRHWADFEAREMIDHFRAKRWPVVWELLHERFKCSRCGSKRLRCDPAGAPDPPPTPIAAIRPRPSPAATGEAPPALRIAGGKGG